MRKGYKGNCSNHSTETQKISANELILIAGFSENAESG